MIQLFMSYTEQTPSPPIFRLWAGIALVAGALERRVWSSTGTLTTYPNLFVFLVGAPGVGKQVVDDVGELWGAACAPDGITPAFHVAPDNMTKASMIDELSKARRSIQVGGGTQQFHGLLIPGPRSSGCCSRPTTRSISP